MEEVKVDYDEMRRRIHEAITEIIGEEENESTITSGWILVFEGIHEADRRSISWVTCDATGEQSLAPWIARGYMTHVNDMILIGSVGGDAEEEDED